MPPPPPPGLTPPPNAVGYEGGAYSSVRLERTGGLARWITILLAVSAITSLVSAALTPAITDNARDFLDGAKSDDDFTAANLSLSVPTFIGGAVGLALVVLSIIWLHRVVRNHRAIGRGLRWSPGWAIGGWFLPPLVLYIIPLLVLRENWKASDPESPVGDDSRWRASADPPVLWVWWVLYGLAPIVFIVLGTSVGFGGGFGGDIDDIAENIVDSSGITIGQQVVNVLAAVAWALVVRGLTARHRRLTGEPA